MQRTAALASANCSLVAVSPTPVCLRPSQPISADTDSQPKAVESEPSTTHETQGSNELVSESTNNTSGLARYPSTPVILRPAPVARAPEAALSQSPKSARSPRLERMAAPV